MDQTMMNNGYGYGMGMPPYYSAPQPTNPSMGWGYTPQVPNQNYKTPNFSNALTNEEIAILRSNKPDDRFNINISQTDSLRSICTHKNGQDNTVFQLNDGTPDVWCGICGARWNPEPKTKEEVAALVKELIDAMQNAKWVGDLPIEMDREYFTMMPLLQKFPDIYEIAISNFNKYSAQDATFNAADYSVYAQYNMLMNNGMYYNNAAYMNQQPMYNNAWGQPQPGTVPQPGYYFNQPMGNMPPQNANPYVNPMQAPVGINPNAPNQQFVQQAQNMMPQQQPVYGTPAPQPYQPAPQTPAADPAAQQQPTVTTETKVEV